MHRSRYEVMNMHTVEYDTFIVVYQICEQSMHMMYTVLFEDVFWIIIMYDIV